MNQNLVERYDSRPVVRPQGNVFVDFLVFRAMITPIIIQIAFWLGLLACIIGGLFLIAHGATSRWGGEEEIIGGVVVLIAGPILVRIYCEFLIVFFRINGTLTEIRNILKYK